MKKFFYKRRHYYQKIVITLLLFSFLIFIPYTALVFNVSKNKIINTIHESNNKSLQQMKYNYDYFNEAMANISLSLYLNNDNQSLMYNHDVSIHQSTSQMKKILETTANVYSSIYSISIYNAGRGDLFTTLRHNSSYSNDLLEFISNSSEIPKLKPILREVAIDNASSKIYVFSYFMYDFMNNNQPSSFLVIDQNANWLIDNFLEAQKASKAESTIYLLDATNNQVITANQDSIPEDENRLLKNYNEGIKSAPTIGASSSSYIDEIENVKYLVTHLTLDEQHNAIVLIQKYNEVFSDFLSLQRSLIIIICLWAAIYIIAIVFISRELYRPISKLASFINNYSGADYISTDENEFEQFQTIYRSSSEKLKMQNSFAYSQFLNKYHIERLITTNSTIEWEQLKKNLPNHWLLRDRKSVV